MNDGDFMVKNFDSIINELSNMKVIRIWLKDDVYELIKVEKNKFGSANIYIDFNYYNKNKEIIENFVCNLIKKNSIQIFDIVDKDLVTNTIKNEIIKCNTIKDLRLGLNPKNSYNFTYEDYVKFMKSNLTSVESPTNDDRLKNQSGYDNTYSIISFNPSNLIIDRFLSDAEINDVINEYTTKITFTDKGLGCFNKIINNLEKLNIDTEVTIMLKDKNKFNKMIFSNYPNYKNIKINMFSKEMTLDEYFSYEKLLYQMVESAKEFSPFEKYVYAYNITKLFKEYKDHQTDEEASRDLYRILDNEFMVCAGYANLLCDLLDKLGIENHYLVEAVYTKEKKSWHARTYSHIADEKYGIDGFYRSDPTWDSKIENYIPGVEYDMYNHIAMTEKEATNSKTPLYVDLENSYELFNISSMEEFYHKINFMQNKTYMNLEGLCRDIIYRLESLDKRYVEYLKLKYNFIDQNNWPNNLNELVRDLGNYILNKVNNPISLDKVMQAVEVVYRHSYGYGENYNEDDINELMNLVREMNENGYKNYFNEDNEQEKTSDIKQY